MDVGYYISELLGQHGDVNVPGLGYFAHTRVNGYYNDKEGRFYPPGFTVQYNPQFIEDDDALAVHIAVKKNISVASSKYFTQKFVAALKEQAAIGEATLAGVGWFKVINSQLAFSSNDDIGKDPEFFGFPAIGLFKTGKQQSAPQFVPAYQPETAAPAPAPVYIPQPQEVVAEEQYQTEEEQEEYLMELTTQKRRNTTWIFIVLGLLVTALIVFLVQRYDHNAFNFNFGDKPKPVVEPKIIVVHEDTAKTQAAPGTDSTTVVKATPPADTLTSTKPVIKDSAAMRRYEIIGGSFRDIKEATQGIANFKALGVTAKIVGDAPGKRFKISVGTYKTRGAAEDARVELLAAKKVGKDAYTIEIDPHDK